MSFRSRSFRLVGALLLGLLSSVVTAQPMNVEPARTPASRWAPIATPTPVPRSVEMLPRDCELADARLLFIHDPQFPVSPEQERYVDILEKEFSGLFAAMGVRTVNARQSGMLAGHARQVALEHDFLTYAQGLAMDVNAELIMSFHVSFREVGFTHSAPGFRSVQDTVAFELYRVDSAQRIAADSFLAAGASDLPGAREAFMHAHEQAMQRATSPVDGGLARKIFEALRDECERTARFGRLITVGLYFQGTDPARLVRSLRSELQAGDVSAESDLRELRNVSSFEPPESYLEFEFRSRVSVGRLRDRLDQSFVDGLGLRDRFRVQFNTTGNNLVIALLDEERPQPLGPYAPAFLGAGGRRSGGTTAGGEALPSSVLREIASQGTVVVHADGRAVAAGVVVSAGHVVTDAEALRGATRFEIEGSGASGRVRATVAFELADHGLAILDLSGGQLPAGIAPLTLGDGNALREGDAVLAAAPQGRAAAGARTVSGRVLGLDRIGGQERILHTATLSEMTNGAPLLNDRGEVVGICMAGESVKQSAEIEADQDTASTRRTTTTTVTRTQSSAVLVNVLLGELPRDVLMLSPDIAERGRRGGAR